MSDIIRVPFGYLPAVACRIVGNYGLASSFFALILEVSFHAPFHEKQRVEAMKIARVSPKMKALN